jgi:hypothetical protein
VCSKRLSQRVGQLLRSGAVLDIDNAVLDSKLDVARAHFEVPCTAPCNWALCESHDALVVFAERRGGHDGAAELHEHADSSGQGGGQAEHAREKHPLEPHAMSAVTS